MEDFKYYPVVDCDSEGSVKVPLFAACREETVRQKHSVWLKEIVPHYFRLCSTETGADTLKGNFTIRCPLCGNALTELSKGVDKTKHGLYVCHSCTED